jgi:hypothetical protein
VGAKVGALAVLKHLAFGTVAGLATMSGLHFAGVLPNDERPATVAAQPAAQPSADRSTSAPAPAPLVPAGREAVATEVEVTTTIEASAPPRVTARRAEMQSAAGVVAAPAIDSEAVPAARAAFEPPAEVSPTAEPKSERAPSLAQEISALDEARRALRAQNPQLALKALDTYARTSPTRVLETEATVLRIDALVQLGDRARASVLAREFVAGQPSSRHAERLRQLANEAGD